MRQVGLSVGRFGVHVHVRLGTCDGPAARRELWQVAHFPATARRFGHTATAIARWHSGLVESG